MNTTTPNIEPIQLRFDSGDTYCTGYAFRYCHRNQVQTAKLLGISRNIVRARLLKIGEIKAESESIA